MKIKDYIGDIEDSIPIIFNGSKTNYRIFENGMLISFYFNRWVVIKPLLNRRGYSQVCLRWDGFKKNKVIHRLVADAFIDNPNNYPCINHKDGNKLNNHKDNLERCTHSQNNQHAHDIGLASVFRRKSGAIPKKVGKYFAGILLKKYEAIGHVMTDGYPRTSIQRAAKKEGFYQGFQWKFITNGS